LDSGLITTGPITDEFEQKFARRHGCRYGLLVNSGTSALHIALAALKEKYGWDSDSEVIVPALTFIASSNVIVQNGLVPVFADCDLYNYNIDPVDIAAAITPKTKAILVVHLFGLPAPMEEIMEIAKEHGLKVIEDSCETVGASYQGKPVGSFGDVACFSLYAAHHISAGVGGVCTTSDLSLMELIRSYANHGRDPEFLGFKNSTLLDPGRYLDGTKLKRTIQQRFKFDRFGFSYRATQFEAALALGQLERIDEIIEKRQRNADMLSGFLKDEAEIQLPSISPVSTHSFMMYPIVLKDDKLNRDELCHYIEMGAVETRPFFNILNQKPYIERFGDLSNKYPVATWLSRSGFYVGCHQQLTHHDMYYIGETIKAGLKALRRLAA
jgi:perosamine synthetase